MQGSQDWQPRRSHCLMGLGFPICRIGMVFLDLPASPGSCEKMNMVVCTTQLNCLLQPISGDRPQGKLRPQEHRLHLELLTEPGSDSRSLSSQPGLFYPSFSPFCPEHTQVGRTASCMGGQDEAELVQGPGMKPGVLGSRLRLSLTCCGKLGEDFSSQGHSFFFK